MAEHNAASADRERRYLALGDSYTIGEGVSVADRWPVQLVERLRGTGTRFAASRIIAATGWTTAELLAGIEREQPLGPYHLVSLLIGVNNQYRGASEAEYREEFCELLNLSRMFAGGRVGSVVVLSIPDWSVTPFASGCDCDAIARAIDRFNAINQTESKNAGVRYVDVTAISREAATDPTLIAADGLHPSAKMYARWAERVSAAIAGWDAAGPLRP